MNLPEVYSILKAQHYFRYTMGTYRQFILSLVIGDIKTLKPIVKNVFTYLFNK